MNTKKFVFSIVSAIPWAYLGPLLLQRLFSDWSLEYARIAAWGTWSLFVLRYNKWELKGIFGDLKILKNAWCETKGWWIHCNKECQSCPIPEVKNRVSKGTAAFIIIGEAIAVCILLTLCSYVILTGRMGLS